MTKFRLEQSLYDGRSKCESEVSVSVELRELYGGGDEDILKVLKGEPNSKLLWMATPTFIALPNVTQLHCT